MNRLRRPRAVSVILTKRTWCGHLGALIAETLLTRGEMLKSVIGRSVCDGDGWLLLVACYLLLVTGYWLGYCPFIKIGDKKV